MHVMGYLITKQMFEINERMDSDMGMVAAKFVTKLKNYVYNAAENKWSNDFHPHWFEID